MIIKIIKNILYFYRIISWQNKIAWSRNLAYVVLGYASSSVFSFFQMFLNLIIISGIFMTAYALNDYYDFKFLKENNFLGSLIKNKKISSLTILFLSFVPLLFLFLLFLIKSKISILLIIIFLVVTIFYSLPPLRLKNFFGWIFSPFCAVIIFFQSFFITGVLNKNIIFLGILVLLLHIYTEMIHFLESCQTGEIVSKKSKIIILKIFKKIPLVSFLLGLYFFTVNPIFIVAIIFSLIRLWSLRKVDAKFDFYKLHRNIFSPVYSVYEFVFYIFAGLLNLYL